MEPKPHRRPHLMLPSKKLRACIASEDQHSTCGTASHAVEVVEQSLFVPLELFVDIVGRFGWKERVSLSHVSRAWRRAVLMEPKFWKFLEVDLADATRALPKTTIFVERSQGELSCLRYVIQSGLVRPTDF